MNLAIIHYHLNTGGVTRVIDQHLRALDLACKNVDGEKNVSGKKIAALVLHGPNDPTTKLSRGLFKSIDVEFFEIKELGYDESQTESNASHPSDAADQLIRQLKKQLAARNFEPQQTILHIHNHSLGKNLALPIAIHQLATDGFGLLLQIHDFVEDFRPQNFLRLSTGWRKSLREIQQWLYPQSGRIHYGVINGRDQGFLNENGFGRVHLLPNPVPDFFQHADRHAARTKVEKSLGQPLTQPLIVYPVRAIRRKNFGEAILLSALFKDRYQFGLTLPATQPQEQNSYRLWRELTSEFQLPWHFDLGLLHDVSFPEVLAAADACLTTSVAEGFGMAFLECYLAGKPLVGRNLPEITRDFIKAGMRLSQLYDALPIPIDWVKCTDWQSIVLRAFKETCEAYLATDIERDLSSWKFDPYQDAEEYLANVVSEGFIDFAFLPVEAQSLVIRKIASNERDREILFAVNPKLNNQFEELDKPADKTLGQDPDTVFNASIIRQHYSLARCGEKLLGVYRQVLEEPIESASCDLIQMGKRLESFGEGTGLLSRPTDEEGTGLLSRPTDEEGTGLLSRPTGASVQPEKILQRFLRIDRFHVLRVQ